MIGQKDILDAVNLMLVSLGKNRTIYRDPLPEDFDRPSYFLSAGPRQMKPVTRWAFEVVQPIKVLCIGQIDADGNAQSDALREMSDEVLQLFAAGFVPVQSRALHIDGTADKQTAADGVEVTMTLRYFDDAPSEADTETVIKQVITNTQMQT